MGLILLEALAALLLLIGIVWWTMFSGRKGGEIDRGSASPARAQDRATPATSAVGVNPVPADRHPDQSSGKSE